MCSKLQVQTQRRYQDGAAVAIVARMVHILKSDRRISAAPDVQCVIRFEDIFAAVIEAAVPQKKPEAGKGEGLLMVARDSDGDDGQAGTIEFPLPENAAGPKHAQD